MARFFPYDEVIARQLPPLKDIQWLAGQIARLPPFDRGSAVLCGSVSWGSHSARSDIDVAHFATKSDPNIERAVTDVVTRYVERTKQRFIAPRVDVITIGVETESLVGDTTSASAGAVKVSKAGGVSSGNVGEQPANTIFFETMVRFSDHIGSLAQLKGDPWQGFHRRYLTASVGGDADRREAIKMYVAAVTNSWEQQPLHPLNGDEDGRFSEQQLDLLGQAENYPVNLMRRILGALGRYPRPDRIPDVRDAFAELDQPWSQGLLAHAQPFFAISAEYDKLLTECGDRQKPSVEEYHERLRALFDELPFAAIQETVWEFMKS